MTLVPLLVTAAVAVGSFVPAVPDAGDSEVAGGRRHGYRFTRMEKCFLQKIATRRKWNDRRSLEWDKQLGYVARRHARAMSRAGGIWHQTDLGRVVTRWRRLGQNVGKGGGCRRLFHAFWHSGIHRDNILGHWRFMGVGVRWSRGSYYVHQVFEYRRNPGNVYNYP